MTISCIESSWLAVDFDPFASFNHLGNIFFFYLLLSPFDTFFISIERMPVSKSIDDLGGENGVVTADEASPINFFLFGREKKMSGQIETIQQTEEKSLECRDFFFSIRFFPQFAFTK